MMRLAIPVDGVEYGDYICYFEEEKLPPFLRQYATPTEFIDIEAGLRMEGIFKYDDVIIVKEGEKEITVSVNGETLNIPKIARKQYRVAFVTIEIIMDDQKIIEIPPLSKVVLIRD